MITWWEFLPCVLLVVIVAETRDEWRQEEDLLYRSPYMMTMLDHGLKSSRSVRQHMVGTLRSNCCTSRCYLGDMHGWYLIFWGWWHWHLRPPKGGTTTPLESRYWWRQDGCLREVVYAKVLKWRREHWQISPWSGAPAGQSVSWTSCKCERHWTKVSPHQCTARKCSVSVEIPTEETLCWNHLKGKALSHLPANRCSKTQFCQSRPRHSYNHQTGSNGGNTTRFIRTVDGPHYTA